MRDSEEIRVMLERWFAAARHGDVDAFGARFSKHPEALTIGSDEPEWYRGEDAVRIARAQMVDLGGGLPMHERDVEAWVEGDVAWGAARVDIKLPDRLIPARATLVLRIEQGDWRIVQYHLSLPVPDEAAFGVDLTKSLAAIVHLVSSERPILQSSGSSVDGVIALAFTDIVDSTAITRSIGDHAWLTILKEHDRIIDSATADHGGEVVKHIGDGAMLAFPSARRSISCAQQIRAGVASRFNNQEPPIQLRIGMHLGEPLRDADDFYGSAVNFAARVTSAAKAGEIVVSEAFASVVSQFGDVAVAEVRAVELKGFQGIHRLFEIG